MGHILSPESSSSSTPAWIRITYTPPDRKEHLSKSELKARVKQLRAEGMNLVEIGMALNINTSCVGAMLREES